MNIPITIEQQQFIRDNYPTQGTEYCAVHLGLNIKKVKYYVNKQKIKVTPEYRAKCNKAAIRVAIQHKKDNPAPYQVDPNQFINVTTPEVAYILGILWADGTLSKGERRHSITLNCLAEDMDEIMDVFIKTGKWNRYTYSRIGRKIQGVLQTNNKTLVYHLRKHDYVGKSIGSACSILSTIPDHLKHYWFRGLIDGDGCFYVRHSPLANNFTIASSYEQDWTYINNIMKKLGIEYGIRRYHQIQNGKTNKSSVIKIGSRAGIVRFGEWLYQGYPNDGIGFKRKYDKYLIIKARYDDPHKRYHQNLSPSSIVSRRRDAHTPQPRHLLNEEV